MKKRVLSLALMGVMAATVAGCGSTQDGAAQGEAVQQESPVGSADGDKTIAIVPWSMAETFAVDFSHAAQEEIEARGWQSVVMDPKGDWTTEFTILENLITQGVDGIIYTAIDADGANDIVDEVKAAGIPIVGYDCLSSAGNEDAAVRYDDYRGGEIAAEQAMEALGGKEDATIVVFEDDPSISSSTLRVNGFCDYIAANYPGVEVILNRTQDKTADGCYIWATDMITAYPDADAFFCYWAECTMATYNALQDAGNTTAYVIGYDATEEQQTLMQEEGENCRLYASPGMSPTKMAVQCVEFLGEIYDGTYSRSGPDDIKELEPVLLTVHNALEFDINE